MFSVKRDLKNADVQRFAIRYPIFDVGLLRLLSHIGSYNGVRRHAVDMYPMISRAPQFCAMRPDLFAPAYPRQRYLNATVMASRYL